MKRSEYEKIVSLLRKTNHSEQQTFLDSVRKEYPSIQASDDTLLSIYSQNFQRFIKQNFRRHHKPSVVSTYYHRFIKGLDSGGSGTIVSLAKEVNFPPVLLCRIVLEEHLKRTTFKDCAVPKGHITQILKSPQNINDTTIANEIQLCIDADENCGPKVDAKRQQIGQHYEDTLKNILTEREIPFRDEDYMRSNGYDKTPDVKLEVPFAVDGNVVNWIESKALFADEESHAGYLQDQYWGYCNRFGPGMVVYWFGFIEELDLQRSRGIMLMHGFPDDVITLDSLL